MKVCIKNIILVVFVFLLVQSCSYLQKPFQKTIIRSNIPAGIDPDLFQWAKVKADSLIPSKESETAAEVYVKAGQKDLEVNESLWAAIEIFMRGEHKKDSLKLLEKAIETEEGQEISDEDIMVIHLGKEGTKKIIKEQPKDTLTAPLLTLMAKEYLDNAMKNFLKAKEINRFDLANVQQIARAYQKRASNFSDTTSSEMSIENYNYIIRYQKGYHFLFARLSENYESIRDWDNAYRNIKEAIRVKMETTQLKSMGESNSVEQDSIESRNILADYWIKRSELETKLVMPDSAIVSWLNARLFALNTDDILFIEAQIQQLMWDNLSIRAAVMKDSLEKLITDGQITEAKAGLLKLLRILRTQKARDEIEFLVSEMDYYYASKFAGQLEDDKKQRKEIERKFKKEAVQRVAKIVGRADVNKSTVNKYEAPLSYNILYYLALDSTRKRFIQHDSLNYDERLVELEKENKLKVDSTYKVLFDKAGKMCFDYGDLKMKQGSYNDAKFYLIRSSGIDWPGSYKPLIKLARFYFVRRQIKESLKICSRVLEMRQKMKPKEIRDYLNFMVKLFQARPIKRRDISRHIYGYYKLYRNGGKVPWENIERFLRPYKV